MSALTEADEVRLAGERALAAEMFPDEWTLALKLGGKRGNNQRAKLRQAAVTAQKLRPLRDAGACCATCEHWKRVPLPGEKRHHCESKSDFHGFVITWGDHLCTDWSQRPGAPPPTLSPGGDPQP